jgi:membrane fusion protein, multidrug efflux system
MNARTTLFVSAALAAGAALLSGCERAVSAPAPPAPAQVSVVQVHRQAIPITIELPGRTSPHLVAQVRARVDGIVLKREFEEGKDVKEGQRLYQIDPAPYQAALNNATAALRKAEASLLSASALTTRYQGLVGSNAISKQDYDNAVSAQAQAEAEVAAARAQIATARINLGYTNVLSPISGRSGISAVTQGALVQANAATLLTTVQKIDPIYVDLTQSSADGLKLRRDVAAGRLKTSGPDQAKVQLTLEDGTPYASPGTLQFSDITVNQGTGSVMVRALLPNPQGVLLPGMFVRARIEAGVANDAMRVPQVGVVHDAQGQATALVVGADDKIEQRTLKLAGTSGSDWIVEGGLNDGDRVVVAGLQRAQVGATVRIAAAPAAAPASAPARAGG